MARLSKTVTLGDGTVVPRLAFGTATAFIREPCAEPLLQAFRAGFMHVDTADYYENCASVGEAIRGWIAEGGKREDIFVTTKWGRKEVSEPRSSLQKQLKQMGLDCVDLFLFHRPEWPRSSTMQECWKTMEDLKSEGLCRSIGVSNFKAEHLSDIAESWRQKPCVNQVEYHPYCAHSKDDRARKALSATYGIPTSGYSTLIPLNRDPGGPCDEVVTRIARSRGLSETQVLLLWALQSLDGPVVTVTRTEKRMTEYLAVFEVDPLNEDHMREIAEAGEKHYYRRYRS